MLGRTRSLVCDGRKHTSRRHRYVEPPTFPARPFSGLYALLVYRAF